VQSVEDLAAQAKDFVYLASPYSLGGTANDADMDRRYRQITRCCHALTRLGANIYSPITHHHSTQSVGGIIKGDSNYWLAIDFGVLKHAKGMYVLTLDGWEKSVCVSREIEYARDKLDIPVMFIRPDKYILGDGYD